MSIATPVATPIVPPTAHTHTHTHTLVSVHSNLKPQYHVHTGIDHIHNGTLNLLTFDNQPQVSNVGTVIYRVTATDRDGHSASAKLVLLTKSADRYTHAWISLKQECLSTTTNEEEEEWVVLMSCIDDMLQLYG